MSKIRHILYPWFLLVLIGCSAVSEREATVEVPDDSAESSSVDTASESSQFDTESPSDPTEASEELAEPTGTEQANASEQPVYGYTNHRPDGNRLVAGHGTMPQMPFTDIVLAGQPLWIVATQWADGSNFDGSTIWAVVLADGQTQAFLLRDGAVEEIEINPVNFPESAPVLRVANGQAELLVNPGSTDGQAPPAVFSDGESVAYSTTDGRIIFDVAPKSSQSTVEVQALPDGRLLVDEQDRLIFLSEPTTRYDHGIMGDRLEAAAITRIDSNPSPEVAQTISVPENHVIEGIAPLWVDMTGDGRREIIVTQSGFAEGAQIVVYDESGDQLASGPAIGLGYRWRHQIAFAPFGPKGELELVDVLTPHIGGVVEFFQLEGDELRIVAQVPGYTSHIIGSRNLDMALAGDFDGDNQVELLLPNQSRTELGGIQRNDEDAAVAWTVDLEGRLISNLAAVTLKNGEMLLGAGRDDGVLRIWHP
jgi:hypothetical protein